MATLYPAHVAGNWSDATWNNLDDGLGALAAPASPDSARFTALSPNITFDAGGPSDLTMTGYVNTFLLSAKLCADTVTVDGHIDGAFGFSIGGNITIRPTADFTPAIADNGYIELDSAGAGGTLTTNGALLPAIQDLVGGSTWALADNVRCQGVTLAGALLDATNRTITCTAWAQTGGGITGGTIYCSGNVSTAGCVNIANTWVLAGTGNVQTAGAGAELTNLVCAMPGRTTTVVVSIDVSNDFAAGGGTLAGGNITVGGNLVCANTTITSTGTFAVTGAQTYTSCIITGAGTYSGATFNGCTISAGTYTDCTFINCTITGGTYSGALVFTNCVMAGFILAAVTSLTVTGGSWNIVGAFDVTTNVKFDSTVNVVACGVITQTGTGNVWIDQPAIGLVLAAAGQVSTLTHNLRCQSLSTSTGTLACGAYTVAVGGNILINDATTLTSTGAWTQTASGNIQNRTVGNTFAQLNCAGAGVVSTLVGTCYATAWTAGAGTIAGAAAIINCTSFFGYGTTITASGIHVGTFHLFRCAISDGTWPATSTFEVCALSGGTYVNTARYLNCTVTGGTFTGNAIYMSITDYPVSRRVVALGTVNGGI